MSIDGIDTKVVSYCNTDLEVPPFFRSAHTIPMGYLDRLAALRKRKGFTQYTLAERMGVEQPTIQRWEAGKREPNIEQLLRLAEILDVEPGALLDDSIAAAIGPRLYVKGEVAAGAWKVAVELPETQWQTFSGCADVKADPEVRFGLRVADDSMNKVYPIGSILECISLRSGSDLVPGKRVIVVRMNVDGKCEATVKELAEQDGELWLVPHSHNPSHRPFKLTAPEDGIVETRIIANVVASIRPE